MARRPGALGADDHNLAYQGLFPRDALPRLGVPEAAFQVDGAEFYGHLSFLKAGIFYASQVTTVSETYAREIQTPDLGCGLDGLLRTRAAQNRLCGILNGIDESFDPATDPHLVTRFEPDDWKGKRAKRGIRAAASSASPSPAGRSSPSSRASCTRRAST